MLYFGLVFGVVTGNVAAHQAGMDPLRAYIATLLLIIPALAGARLLYVAVHWKTYRGNLRRIWDRREGGYIMYGGLPVVLLCSVPLLYGLRLSFGVFWDVSSFTILTGMLFTRVGCLLNGCCCGRPSQSWFAIRLPDSQGIWERRVPTQLLETAWAAVLLVSASLVWRRMPFAGALFLFVTLGYSSARFVMEFARERGPRPGSFRLAHAISIIAFVSSVLMLTLCRHK